MNFDTFKDTTKHSIPPRPNICLVRGKDNTVFDASDRAYIDFTGGNGENVLGYSHPAIIDAVSKQTEKLHCIASSFYNEIADELAKDLVEGTVFDRVLFERSGAETLDSTINIISNFYKAHGENKKILIVADSLECMSFGNAYLNRYRNQNDILKFTPQNDFDAFKKNLTKDIGAVIFEVYQTENGLSLTKHDFLLQAYAHCKINGVFLVMNESVSGLGRTGQMFSYQYSGINPDLVMLSKGLGAGLPISVVLARGEIGYSIPKNFDSFSSRYLPSLAAARVVLKELKYGLAERVDNVGNYLKAKLFKLTKFEFVKEIRGGGLMLGLELDAKISAREVIAKMAKEGVLAYLPKDKNTIIFLPPYTITRKEIDSAVEIMSNIFYGI